MDNEKDLHYQFPESVQGSAYGLDSSYGFMPPEFSLTSGAPETQQDALNRHRNNIALTTKALEEMKVSGVAIEVNTAEWLSSNLNEFYMATQTHDTEQRAQQFMNSSQFYAYFGGVYGGNQFPSTNANYNADITKSMECDFVPKTTSARVVDGKISLYDPIKKGNGTAEIKQYLIHEVQHVADHLEEKEEHDAPDNVDDAWLNYQSEFKSYWVSGEFDQYSPDVQYGGTGFSERQWKIYYHIKTMYPYVDAFETETVTKSPVGAENGKTLGQLIRIYSEPSGINLENSPRIEAFFKAIQNCKPTMTRNDQEITEAFAKAGELQKSEINDLFWDDNKIPIRDLMKSNLSSEIHTELNMELVSN